MNLWSLFVEPFGIIMRFCYNLFNSYGVALLMYAVITKIITAPLSIKQHKSSLSMIRLKPYQDELVKKYGANKQKYQEELMKLYQKEGYSPMSSCLPMLIQFPVIMLIYTIVRRPLTFVANWSLTEIWTKMQQIGLDEIAKNITDKNFHKFELQLLTKLAEMGEAPIHSTFLGIFDLSATPKSNIASWLILIPILAGVTAFLSGWLSQKLNPQAQMQQGSMKMMIFMMPLISVWMSYEFTAALGLYWIYSNIIGIGYNWLQNKIYNPQKILNEVNEKMENERLALKEKKAQAAAKKAAAMKKVKKNKPVIELPYTNADVPAENKKEQE